MCEGTGGERILAMDKHTLSAEELSRDVEGLAADNNDLLAVQELLGDSAGQATEQVSLAVDDDLYTPLLSAIALMTVVSVCSCACASFAVAGPDSDSSSFSAHSNDWVSHTTGWNSDIVAGLLWCRRWLKGSRLQTKDTGILEVQKWKPRLVRGPNCLACASHYPDVIPPRGLALSCCASHLTALALLF